MLLLTATPQIVVPGFWCPVFIYAVLNRAGYRVKKKPKLEKKNHIRVPPQKPQPPLLFSIVYTEYIKWMVSHDSFPKKTQWRFWKSDIRKYQEYDQPW